MNETADNILNFLKEFQKTADSRGIDLRLSLSDIICKEMKRQDISIGELATRTGWTEGYIGSIIHSNVNCSFLTVGKILVALDIHANIEIVSPNQAGIAQCIKD